MCGLAALPVCHCAHPLNTHPSCTGGDLPGLLCNWGVGATTAADHVPDLGARRALLETGVARLSAAAGFTRGDPQPAVALGEALAALGECVAAGGGAGEGGRGEGRG